MTAILGQTKKTVPFSAFNDGKAEEIFAEVRRSGPCIVMNGSKAEGVIVPMDEYELMTMDRDDVRLIAVADERMSHFDLSRTITQEEMDQMLGITEADLEGWEDIELE
jgi:PHD/YefM family antitoxin component YafN of YafNO toxin-antitoxin module